MQEAKKHLQTYFGYASFRIGQEQAIAQVLDGIDTLVVMPTGVENHFATRFQHFL